MKRKPATLLLSVVAIILLIAAGLWITGWRPNFDPSLELGERWGKFGIVENGSAYDRAAVDLDAAKRLILPDTAIIRDGGVGSQVEIFMKKTLGFHGHPPSQMSIRDTRKKMGCAVKIEDDGLVIATFGEWESKEGGAHLRLIAVVPNGVKVEQRKDLSGPHSIGREWQGFWLTKPKDAKSGCWYGPASASDGWRGVPTLPDAGRTGG
jgi:hypothetical protein